MLSKEYNNEKDLNLIRKALAGDKASLEMLVKTHQDYIYNIALRFFLNPDDALDATQEILIKVITGLKTFKGESAFRTWAYRISLNHFLNAKKSKTEFLLTREPERYSGFSEQKEPEPHSEAEIEEVRILCSTAMLMCLDREQRLLYILGEIFHMDHNLGAELFNISKAHYRVKLHRAKTDLLSFVSGKCGIIDPINPCRCPKKTRKLVEEGFVNKDNLLFNTDFSLRVKELVTKKKNEISDKIQLELKELFQDSPFQVKDEIDQLIDEILA